MTDSIQSYDVKVVVRSALKLLPEIKRLLSSNPNRLNLFRRTVFGPWLDLPSHYNDNHLMHYVLQHQVKPLDHPNVLPPLRKKGWPYICSCMIYMHPTLGARLVMKKWIEELRINLGLEQRKLMTSLLSTGL
ncbi:hypothetical protein Tco_1081662 [Tanacetum coccineum]|uniref:Uncharacterized protein n=1 Tax=Tanacetum coccineum TaxID=301880 RepID=A0ABQ5HZU7_9ASTR